MWRGRGRGRSTPGLPGDLFAIEQALSRVLEIVDWREDPNSLYVVGRFHPFILRPFTRLQETLDPFGYDYHVQRNGDWIVLRLWEEKEKGKSHPWALHLFLFLLTVLSTLYAGALQEGADPFRHPSQLLRGIPFSFTLMTILTIHEFGHYYASSRRHIQVTLPYFIPAPSLLGTFGAFIRMKSPISDRRTLLEVGVAGPLFGFAVALPALAAGLALSRVSPPTGSPGLNLGSSLLLLLLSRLIIGPLPPDWDLVLHPMAFAGWIGTLITALNLLPIGQLDGGHVAYALWGRKQHLIARWTFFALILMGFFWQGWLFWAFLSLLLGLRHPPLLDDWTPLDPPRRAVGLLAFLIFILCFIPVPFQLRSP
jgi:membrane-associated protease RseP (regulator of RpoE activity)